MAIVVGGRSRREQEDAVGLFATWAMFAVPVDGDTPLKRRAGRMHGRLLNALRLPPRQLGLLTALCEPELADARNWPYHESPWYLQANHLGHHVVSRER